MAKQPKKPKREEFNQAAFRVVREVTQAHEPEPVVQSQEATKDEEKTGQ